MYRYMIFLFILIFISSCVSPRPFTVSKSDNRFSENKNPVYFSNNNRISKKSVAGGIHIDGTGVFVNPFVEKNLRTKATMLVGFKIKNETSYNSLYGNVNQLGVVQKIVFRINGGEIVALKVGDQKNQTAGMSTYNSISNNVSTRKMETGIALVDKNSYYKIAYADRLSCKIIGSARSVVYEEKDISLVFKENLKKFYVKHLK